MTNLELWKKVQSVPDNAKKAITGGRLKGMTDINPMWRLQALTEQFGPCGVGWKYEVVDKHLETGANGEIAAFVDILLYHKHNSEWSEGIPGTGGASFVAKEKNGLYTSDECFKMALTDAISVACKALGFGADVYWQAGGSKYGTRPDGDPKGSIPKGKQDKCSVCDEDIPPSVATYSTKKYGKALCLKCQKEAK
jgi:hypothetical protein